MQKYTNNAGGSEKNWSGFEHGDNFMVDNIKNTEVPHDVFAKGFAGNIVPDFYMYCQCLGRRVTANIYGTTDLL